MAPSICSFQIQAIILFHSSFKGIECFLPPQLCPSGSHVQMCELDHKEGREPKNRCFWTVVLEKTLGSPLDYKDIKPDNPKGNQCWIFIVRTDAEAKAPVLWPSVAKSRPIGKDLMLFKTEDWSRTGRQRMRCWMASPTQWTWVWANSREIVKDREAWCLQSMWSQSWTRLSNRIATTAVSLRTWSGGFRVKLERTDLICLPKGWSWWCGVHTWSFK